MTGRAPSRTRPRARGFASVLAMLYLVLFSVLARAFYWQVNVYAQVAQSEVRVAQSRVSAETGLMWIRHHLAGVSPGNDASATLTTIAAQLATKLNGTTNLGAHAVEQATDAGGDPIVYIPGRSFSGGVMNYNWIDLGATAGRARIELRMNGSSLCARAYGRDSSGDAISRAVECEFTGGRTAWVSPGAGVLTRSTVQITNGAKITGGDVTSLSSKSTPSLDIGGGAQIEKNFYYGPHAKPPQISNGAKVRGTIAQLQEEFALPEVDGSIFESFVPPATAPLGPQVLGRTSTIGSTAVLTNIRIKANSNLSFGNAVRLNGVIFIESPNKISFGGGGRINGVIVTDNNAANPLAGNQITIDNGIRMEGVETLDPSQFSFTYRIDELVNLKGALILAPNFKVVLAGGARSYNGSMVASEFDISNGYRGTITGNLINLDDSNFKMVGGGQLSFQNSGDPVTGLYSAGSLKMASSTYREVTP